MRYALRHAGQSDEPVEAQAFERALAELRRRPSGTQLVDESGVVLAETKPFRHLEAWSHIDGGAVRDPIVEPWGLTAKPRGL